MRYWCKALACDQTAISRGWCGKHYRRWLRHGDVEHVDKVREHPADCVLTDCIGTYYAKGYCKPHYDAIRQGRMLDPMEVMV